MNLSPESNAGSGSLRILVADDDPLNLRVAARLLREQGHSGALVTNGQQVLDALARQAFDLLLLDIHMPVLDGLATLQALRGGGGQRNGGLPVIVVTGDDGAETRAHFLAAGANGFLVKPLTAQTLAQEIQRFAVR